jgi:hypothetical protein
MPLPQFRKFILVNNSGQDLTFNNNGRVNIKETAIHFNTVDGKVVYTQLPDDDLGFIAASDITFGAEIVGDNEVDNTSTTYVQSQIQIEITHDEGLAADGVFDLYMAMGDASGELETDASGYVSAEANNLRFIGSLTWESSAADDDLMRSEIFTIG